MLHHFSRDVGVQVEADHERQVLADRLAHDEGEAGDLEPFAFGHGAGRGPRQPHVGIVGREIPQCVLGQPPVGRDLAAVD